MSDVTTPVNGKSDDMAQMSWNNCIQGLTDPVSTQDHTTDDWKISFARPGALAKKEKGNYAIDSSEAIEASDQKSTKWQEFVKATSPIVASFLPQVKESNPSADIDVLGAAVDRLTTDAEKLTKARNAAPVTPRKKLIRYGENHTANRQTKKTLAEIAKRRKLRNEEREAKKSSKQPQPKEESINNIKTSCTVCGMTLSDGQKHICKSCTNRQKRDKSRDKSQGHENVKDSSIIPVPITQTEDNNPTDILPLNQEIPMNDSSTKEDKHTGDENHVKNRSLSLDSKDITDTISETNNKYAVKKRTNTDLGSKPNNSVSKNDDSGEQTPPCTSPQKISSPRNIFATETKKGCDLKQNAELGLNSLDYQEKPKFHISGIGTRQIKRSTTDSEIVNKFKFDRTTGTEQGGTSSANGAKTQALDDDKAKNSPKNNCKGETSAVRTRPSSQENIKVGMKIERSKTLFGKFNLDGDKKVAVMEPEQSKKKEGSNVSSGESDKSYSESKKKLANSGRSHTTIGDGHKRQKPKTEWTKTKPGKREVSSCSIMKESKKRLDKKGSCDEYEKKVCFAEGEQPKCDVVQHYVNNTFPKTLYDCEDNDEDQSSSESEDESNHDELPSQNTGLSKSILKAEERDALTSSVTPAGTKKSQMRTQQTISKWTEKSVRKQNFGSDKKWEQPVYDLIQSNVTSWSDENTPPVDYDQKEYDRLQCQQVNYDDIEYDKEVYDGICGYQNEENEYEALETIEEKYSEYEALETIEEKYSDDVYASDSHENIYSENIPKRDASPDYFQPMKKSECQEKNKECTDNNQHIINHLSSLEDTEDLYTVGTISTSRFGPSNKLASNYSIGKEIIAEREYYTESIYSENATQKLLGNGDSAQNYFEAYETDVDTGLSLLHDSREVSIFHSPKKTTEQKTKSTNSWGFPCASNSDSSSSSDDDDLVECSDSWYTSGFNKDDKSDKSLNDDFVYFNDKERGRLDDTDIYTGDLFSNVVSTGNELTDRSNNKNMIEYEGRNFWIISSRPQMHHTKRSPRSRAETLRNSVALCPYLVEVQQENGMTSKIGSYTFCNFSNNNNDEKDNDVTKPSTSSDKTEYTEYTPELLAAVRRIKPKKDLILLGNKDFSKYDRPAREERVREEGVSILANKPFRADVLFFGEDQRGVIETTSQKSPEHNLYFNRKIPKTLRYDRVMENTGYNEQKEEDYQGGFFYASKYNHNNSNNSEDDDHYTGCFRNEESYKPTQDGLFNDKANSFEFRKRMPEVAPLYFCNANSKSYYDNEESVYAFEKKIEKKPKKPEIPKILKVGNIVVRNNVECEEAYAQNIDMDLREAPKAWMRYNYDGETTSADTSNYAQNVSYEDFGGTKPWVVEECRAPWKTSKTLENSKKVNTCSTTGNDNKMVKSVKSLGSYVTKWF